MLVHACGNYPLSRLVSQLLANIFAWLKMSLLSRAAVVLLGSGWAKSYATRGDEVVLQCRGSSLSDIGRPY
jgi:hypothetical protein